MSHSGEAVAPLKCGSSSYVHRRKASHRGAGLHGHQVGSTLGAEGRDGLGVSHQPQEGSLIHFAKDDEHVRLRVFLKLPHIGVKESHEVRTTLQVRDDAGGGREGGNILS